MEKYLDKNSVLRLLQGVKTQIEKSKTSILNTKGAAKGIASLDENGNVPLSQLGNVDNVLFEIVQELPTQLTEQQLNHIFIVPRGLESESDKNTYKEYIYTGNDIGHILPTYWEELGEFTSEVDLKPYSKKTETVTAIRFTSENANGNSTSASPEQNLLIEFADGHHVIVNVPTASAGGYTSSGHGYIGNYGFMTNSDKNKLDKIDLEALTSSINAANTAADNTNKAIKAAETATADAEKVNATLTEENVFEVTGRTGVKKTLDMSGMVSAQSAINELQSSKIDKASISQETGESEDKVMSQKAVSTKLSGLKSIEKEIIVNTINTPNIDFPQTANFLYWNIVIEGTKYADTIEMQVRENGEFNLYSFNVNTKKATVLETISVTKTASIMSFKLKELYHISDDELFVIGNTKGAPVQYYIDSTTVMRTIDLDSGIIYNNQTGIPLVHLTAKYNIIPVLTEKANSAYDIAQANKKNLISTENKITNEIIPNAIKNLVKKYWDGKTVAFVGDSYADNGGFIFDTKTKKMYHPTWPEVFAKNEQFCNVIDGAKAGQRIVGTIYECAVSYSEKYGDKISKLDYKITETSNIAHTTIGGKLHLSNCKKLDYLLVNVFPNSSDNKTLDWLNLHIWKYKNGSYTELGKYSYMHEMPNNNTWDWSFCIAAIYLDEAIEINEDEDLAISFTVGERYEDTRNCAINIVDDDKTYICDGEEKKGTPLIQYGYRSKLDYMIFQGGLNDTNSALGVMTDSYDLNQDFDTNTYYGCLEKMISSFRKNSPTTHLGWIIPTGAWQTKGENVPIKEVCKKWSVPVLDFDEKYRKMYLGLKSIYQEKKEIDWYKFSPYYNIKYDGSSNFHPSPVLYKLMNDTIFEWMKTL